MPWPNASRPLVCYVTDRRALPPPSLCCAPHPLGWAAQLLETIARAAEAGVDAVQLREKDLSGKALWDLAVAANARAPKKLLINDRLDVALAVGAAGVHLGGESVPVAEVTRLRSPVAPASRAGHFAEREDKIPAGARSKRQGKGPQAGAGPRSIGAGRRRDQTGAAVGAPALPEGFLVGRSCHSAEEALEAERAGADYVYFGPVYATPSKARFGPPQGLEALAAVCCRVRIPVVAIGGITLENAAACLAAGAAGVAAIRLFQEAADLAAVVRALKQQA